MPEPTTVPEMVAASLALADPAAIAVEGGGSTATYAELDALAWGTTAKLRAAGVGPGAVVGVAISPGPRQVAAWLGVLRAGAAFALLDQAGIEVLREADVEPGPPVAPVPVDERAPAVVLVSPDGENVVWEQENLLHAALTTAWLHELGPDSRLLAPATAAVVEAFACLCSGASLVLTDVVERDGRSFYRAAGCPGFAADIVGGSLRPVPNTRLDVLGAGDEELPDGVEGDLWVFGPGVPGDRRRRRTGDRAVRGRDGELKLATPAEPDPPPSPRARASETGRRRAVELFAETLSAAGLFGEAQRAALREPDADFFRLGGHSLLAVGMVANAARRWNGEVALRDFLAEPTVTGLGALLDTAAEPLPRSPVTPGDGWYPALPAQQRLWFLDRISGLRQAYLVTFVLEYTGPVDAARLAASIRSVLGRHPALRSVFRLDHARRELVYRTDGPAPEVSLVDGRGRSRTEQDKDLDAVLWQPFDLAAGPPARAAVITSGTGATTVALSASHVVLDGWSLRRLADEIGETYRAAGEGRPPRLPEPVHPAEVVSCVASCPTSGAAGAKRPHVALVASDAPNVALGGGGGPPPPRGGGPPPAAPPHT
ncbi:condensation domain-containing protein, partial [Amycolatopsis sp. NPDC021455]|uniref:condensation domain-containing protein n=1 Tax=Amycolatopsis sp. NPDC021455 TaxID=3154901 RepID=UPI0033F0ACFD